LPILAIYEGCPVFCGSFWSAQEGMEDANIWESNSLKVLSFVGDYNGNLEFLGNINFNSHRREGCRPFTNVTSQDF
jgi:hypothetical protein